MDVYIVDQDDKKFFFGEGTLEVDLCANEDDIFEYGSLNKIETKKLYEVMKVYYERG